MAGTQKKSSGSTSPRSSGKKKSTRTGSKKKRPIRREIGGIICLFLALCVVVSYTSETAPVVVWLRDLFCGLLGYGYYLLAVALLLAGIHLIWHHGRPVVLRTVSILLVPVFASAMAQMFQKTEYTWSGILKALYQDGIALKSGGALAGFLGYAASSLMGKLISGVVFALLTVAAFFVGMQISPEKIVEKARQRERLEYEEEPLPPKEDLPQRRPVRPLRSSIDIPLDGDEPPAKPQRKNSFFRHRDASVLTPDQLLNGPSANGAAISPEIQQNTEVSAAVPEPVPMPVIEPEKKTLRPIQKPAPLQEEPVAPSPEEVQQVAQEIDQGMDKAMPSYQFPPLSLLEQNFDPLQQQGDSELRENARRLGDTLRSFGVDAKPYDVIRGPAVTRYEYTLDQGVKLSKITNLADDIALALGASGVRIAPIPDKISVVGIEVPNKTVTPVYIRSVLESREFQEHRSQVAFAVGKDIGGNFVVGNIAKLPHVLIAGTTGSGKSVCTNSLIVSLLYKSSPEDVRFIMVDPKMVELAPYNGIPHLLIPVVTDPKKAAGALQWAVYEMMKRYKVFSEHNVKDLASYNLLAAKQDSELPKLPTVVVVIDELADLMLVAAKEVEESICRVAQMGRAAGMHLVIATQRPSADVITGLMKANIPSRIAFAVASSLESRIILDTTGAEKLVGRGDMLYAPLGEGKPRRVQGCLITAEEIEKVVAFVKQSGETQYSDEVIAKIDEFGKEKPAKGTASGNDSAAAETEDGDELFPAAVEVVLETGQASVSMLQRRLKLGYSRAARIVDEMEQRGIVGPFEGSKPRQLLITREQWQEQQMQGTEPAAEQISIEESEGPPF